MAVFPHSYRVIFAADFINLECKRLVKSRYCVNSNIFLAFLIDFSVKN